MAATATDVTAQVKTISPAQLTDVFAAPTSILDPYVTDPLRIVVSSVVANDNDNGKVAWSCASKGACRAVDSAYAVPPGLPYPGTSVVVAEVTYAFTLLGLEGIFSPDSLEMKRTFHSRPRRSNEVSKPDTKCL